MYLSRLSGLQGTDCRAVVPQMIIKTAVDSCAVTKPTDNPLVAGRIMKVHPEQRGPRRSSRRSKAQLSRKPDPWPATDLSCWSLGLRLLSEACWGCLVSVCFLLLSPSLWMWH